MAPSWGMLLAQRYEWAPMRSHGHPWAPPPLCLLNPTLLGLVTVTEISEVDRILLKHTLNMLVELGVQGKNVRMLRRCEKTETAEAVASCSPSA